MKDYEGRKPMAVRVAEWVSPKAPATGEWISESKAIDGVPYLVEVEVGAFDVWTCVDGKWTVGGEPAPHSPRQIAEIKR
jgi:hypothetical protein